MSPTRSDNVNQTAFIVGFIAAMFGFFGVGHLLNGKILTAVVVFICGVIWLAIFGVITALTFGVGACPCGIAHVALAYFTSRAGASS